MSDWYLDLIPRRGSETPEQAVDRVYPGYIDEDSRTAADDEAWLASAYDVSRADRAFMVEVVDRLLAMGLEFEVISTKRARRRRWPHRIRLESSLAGLTVDVDQNSVALRPDWNECDNFWPHRWRVVRDFVRDGYVVCDSFGMDIWNIRPSWSAAEAARRGWAF